MSEDPEAQRVKGKHTRYNDFDIISPFSSLASTNTATVPESVVHITHLDVPC